MDAIELGLTNLIDLTVSYDDTADAVGNAGALVFSTPSMLLLIENCCGQLVDGLLPAGAGSVGISADFKHLAATPVGMTVRCSAEIIEIDRRRVKFSVTLTDPVETVGTGFHERFIIPDMAAFSQKVAEKSTL